MGMFDYVNVDEKIELPLTKKQLRQIYQSNTDWKRCFQTKSLECLMDTYRITPKGWLKKQPQFDLPTELKFDFNGVVSCHDVIQCKQPGYDIWIELCFEFKTGKVVNIILNEFDRYCNKNRLKQQQLLLTEQKRVNELRSRWLWKVYHYLYRLPVKKSLQMIRRLCGKLQSVEHKLLFWE